MDLSAPLRSLIPSLESAILEVLANTESGLSATAITRLSSRGSRAGQWDALTRLVEHGLVRAEPANRGALYTLNRDHVLAPAVLTAATARREVLNRLTAGVQALRPSVVSAAIYGSFARREAHEDSDVDLLLVTSDEGSDAWDEQVHQLQARFLAWTGNRLEVLALQTRALQRIVIAGEPLVASLRRDALTLTGTDLEALLTSARRRRTGAAN